MKKPGTISLFVLLVFILPVTAYALFHYYEKKIEALPVMGPVKIIDNEKVYHAIGDFQLQNQEGKSRSTAEWKNKIVVADFFFTHCPVICPKMTKSLQRVNENFKSDNEILIQSFSIDPVRDSIQQLQRYASRFHILGGNWDLLTGNKKEIYRLARNSFMITATDGDGGENDFIHSEKLVLIDKYKRIRGFYTGTDENEVDRLLNDIKKLKDEK